MTQAIESPLTSRWATIDGLSTHYLTGGRGELLCLLHGGLIDKASLSWGLVGPLLTERYEIVAPDLPGYGRTAPPRGAVTTATYARWVGKFLDEIAKDRKVTLIGISKGGSVAISTVFAHPDKVSRLVLIASSGLGLLQSPVTAISYFLTRLPRLTKLLLGAAGRRDAAFRNMVSAMFGDQSRVDEDFLAELRREYRRGIALDTTSRYAKAELTRSGVRSDFSHRLSEIAIPTLIVQGTLDPFCPAPVAMEAASRIPKAELKLLSGCGHWVTRERPEETARLIVDFLARHPL